MGYGPGFSRSANTAATSWSRIDAQLLGQPGAESFVHGQRITRPAGLAQCFHQQGMRRFGEAVSAHLLPEESDGVIWSPQLQQCPALQEATRGPSLRDLLARAHRGRRIQGGQRIAEDQLISVAGRREGLGRSTRAEVVLGAVEQALEFEKVNPHG